MFAFNYVIKTRLILSLLHCFLQKFKQVGTFH